MKRLLRSRLSLTLAAFIVVSAAIAIPLSNNIIHSHAQGTVTITEFPLPTNGGEEPIGITAGPDGNLWFTVYIGNKIGKITPTGSITVFQIPAGSGLPDGITAGPDGNLWFAEHENNNIGKITPSGTITEFHTTNLVTSDITAGPDGNLWFTEGSANQSQIGKITPSGALTEFPVTTNDGFFNITTGPDGNLWFTEGSVNKIGRITTSGSITEFPLPTTSDPIGITTGPDGNLWFTEGGGNKIGRITTSGAITEFSIPTANSVPFGITTGPDGNLWFTELGGYKIGEITPSGTITEFPLPTTSGPFGITTGPDGNLWFTEGNGGNRIGRVNLPPSHQKLFVLLQGLSSEFTPIQESQNQYPGFDVPGGIVPYLQGQGYSANTNFLEYGYPVDFPKGTPPEVQQEILENVHSYSCSDTFDHSLNQDVRTLDLQIRFYLSQPGHQNTDVYLIGDSLGGAIGFGYLALLKTQGWPSLPNGGQLKGVITLDAPLGGIPTGKDLLATQIVFDAKCFRFPTSPIKPLTELGQVFGTTQTATPLGGTANLISVIFPTFSVPTGFDNQQLADEAVSHSIDVLTIGNEKDYGYALAGCTIAHFFGLQDFLSSQFVHDEAVPSGVYGRAIDVSASSFCTQDAVLNEINHGEVMTNLTVEQGIVNFIRGNDPSPLVTPSQLIV